MLKTLTPWALSLLRIVAGFTFSLHGFQKVLGLFGGVGAKGGTAPFFSLGWTGGVLELFGGLLILAGLFTRPVAFILCGEMAVAYFMAHARRDFLPIRNGGELAVIYCFVFLYLVFAGGGAASLDRWVRRKF